MYSASGATSVILILLSFGPHPNPAQSISNLIESLKPNKVIWCVTGPEEMKKCKSFALAVERDKATFGSAYLEVGCVKGQSKEVCMSEIEEEIAHITSLDPGEVFIGGRYYSLVPILQELYSDNLRYYYAVAVVKKDSLKDVTQLSHLRGKKACFANVGTQAGWVIPIDTLMLLGGMDIVDCNNHVKTAIAYFGPSCAVNSLQDKFNPIGDNSDKLCQLCIGKGAGVKCSVADPYAGFAGAFRCLVEAGEIAFLKHTTVEELTSSGVEFPYVKKDDFELLCTDGSRRPVEDYVACNWGTVPTHAIVTSSAKSAKQRRKYQLFLQKAVELYGGSSLKNKTLDFSTSPNVGRNLNNRYSQYIPSTSQAPLTDIKYETYNLFESVPRYGHQHNLLLQDVAEQLTALPESEQTYSALLGSSLDTLLAIRRCPVKTMTLCVTSDPEMEKCIKMRTALKAHLLKPEMVCYKGHSHIRCMQAIRNGDADVAVFDAGDVYTAGLHYDLIPFMSEVYNLGTPEYYVVAVAKEEDPTTELTYLKGKYTCHSGMNTAAGWILPMAYLISNNWMRSYGCNSMRAAAEYFSKSCVPGALSTEYNTGVPYDNMCHLCHGVSYRYCRRDATEDYFGHTGAFRCLVEGGGNVAFVKHTTVMENTDGKRREWWSRNTLRDDFQLLCPDGTRTSMNNYRTCNLGKSKANALVTRGGEGYNEEQLNAYINLFTYAQQFYGRRVQNDFSFAMFYSPPPYSDLIFQDASTQLKIIKPSEREYSAYLGKDFMRAKRIVDCFAGSAQLSMSPFVIISTMIFAATLSMLWL